MSESITTERSIGADDPASGDVDLETPVPALHPRRRRSPLRGALAGIGAISAKDLRGRMRGRRAFLVLTGYLIALAVFALYTQAAIAESYKTGFGGSAAFAGAAVGQGVFAALLMLMTLLVVVLAPLATASSVSLEREKQTLDMLMATPIPTIAVVIGKLLSALAWVFLLIAASVPLMAIVFVYGGVGPDGLIAGYLVLIATALGLGAMGLLCSSLVQRTTVATALTVVGVMLVTLRTMVALLSGPIVGAVDGVAGRGGGPLDLPVPGILIQVDPFIAQTAVMCEQESTLGGPWCARLARFTASDDGIIFTDGRIDAVPMPAPVPAVEPGVMIDGKGVIVGGDAGPEVNVAPQQILQPEREAVWPKSVVTWLILSVIFLAVSVQLVSPARRWRFRRRARPAARAAE